MADFVSMDVDKYLQRLPGTEKHPFYIRRVENVVLRQQKLPYIIRIRGMGFGQQPARSWWDTADTANDLKFYVGSLALDPKYIRATQAYETELSIPFDSVNSQFQQHEISQLPLKITAVQTVKHIFKKNEEVPVEMKFVLILLPNVSAVLKVDATTEEDSFENGTPDVRRHSELVGGQGNQKYTFWQRIEDFALTERVVSVEYYCDPANAACGYCVNWDRTRDTLPDHTYFIDNGGHRVTLKKACNGDPAELVWTIHYVSQGKKPMTRTLPKSYEVTFGDTFSVDLPRTRRTGAFTALSLPVNPLRQSRATPEGI